MNNTIERILQEGLIVGKYGRTLIILEKAGKYFSLSLCHHVSQTNSSQLRSPLFKRYVVEETEYFFNYYYLPGYPEWEPSNHILPELPELIRTNNNEKILEKKAEYYNEILKLASKIINEKSDQKVLKEIIESIRMRNLLNR